MVIGECKYQIQGRMTIEKELTRRIGACSKVFHLDDNHLLLSDILWFLLVNFALSSFLLSLLWILLVSFLLVLLLVQKRCPVV